ncbi:MAG TPA: hypothetical protein VMT81_03085, partial [Candidatus Paceibacterota bacterium]|nr:hypothetical protein [Candidatus Paceibacterota bacterium]
MATLKDHWSKARTFAILLGLVLFGSLPAGNVHAQIGTPGSLGTSLLTNASANAAASHPNWNPLSWVAQGLLDIGATVIGKVCFIISYIISWIAGVAIAIETWLVGVILNMNVGIFQQTFVQKGFGVTLSIANLGFVLGIIIIAIATILRRETYGYKSLLWKLVVAAILVNFSLVIAAPIFNLGNEFTQYFLDCIDPSLGCNAGANSTQQLASMNNFALKLSGAFNPQRSIDFASSTVNGASSTAAFSQSQSSSLGASFGQMLVPIFSVLFVAFELIAIVIVLAVFVVQLIIRYVYIAILAILMPFAWLGWVFPTMRSWWSKWWDQFIRWTFFAPIVVFFIYLAIAMMTSLNSATGGSSVSLQTYTSNSNAVWTPVGNFFGSAFSTVIANGLNMLIMIGLTVGGMIVAQKMSISLSDTAIKSVKAAGNAVQGYVGKKTRRVVGDRLRTAGRQYNPTTRETTSWLQRQGSALQNVPGLRRFG